MSLTTSPPHQSTESPSASPDSSISSSSAVLSPTETSILSRMRFDNSLFPAAAVSRLETWSDSASEETYIFYSLARDFDGLQIPPTRSPGSYRILSSRIYTQDSPIEHLLTSPQQGSCSRFSTTCFSISTIHSSI